MSGNLIEFIYEGNELSIQYNETDSVKDITSRCCTKLAKNAEDIYFIYKGEVLNENSNIEQIKNNSDGAKILVFNRSDPHDKTKEENLIDSKDVICPICGENCLINIKNYKIELNKCVNGHSLQNIYFNEFKNIQKINEALAICNNCHKKKAEIYDNQLYICCECNINLCPLCKSKHEQKHTFIDYELKHYICGKHGEKFISHCTQCNKNLCDLCGVEHNKSHGLIYHRDIIKDINYNENLSNLKEKIETMKEQINDIIQKFNKFIEMMDIYYELSEKIINCNINLKSQNYELVMNKNHLNEQNKILNDTLNNIICKTKYMLKFKI